MRLGRDPKSSRLANTVDELDERLVEWAESRVVASAKSR